MTQKEIEGAIQNATPKKPIRIELGGGYYYKCHWLKCNTDLHKWFRFCPGCGQKIEWDDYYVDDFEKLFYEEVEE